MSTTSSLLQQNVLAVENMKHQSDELFIKLTEQFQLLKDGIISKITMCENLDALVFEHTKIKTRTTIQVGPMNAWIEATQYDQSHIFWPEFYQEYDEFRKIMTRPLTGSKGWIDPVNGRVGGVFSEHINPITLLSGILSLAADETAAVYLHEVGHAYTFFFYLGQIALSNIVITQATREAVKEQDVRKRTVIIEQATKYLSIDDRISAGDLAGAPTMNNAKATEAIMVNAFRERGKSATGTDLYDLRSCEQLADQFAARYGAGASLARAVANFEGGTPWQQGRGTVILVTVMKILWEIGLAVMTSGISLAIGLLWCVTMPITQKDYDDHQYRARLIRQQMIDRLRKLQVPNEQRQKLIKDIEDVTKIEKQIGKDAYGLAFRIAMCISSKRRKEFQTQELQKALEDLIFNPLFVTQAKLLQMETT